MGRNEDGRPGAYTSSIKADGYGAPHKLSEHAGMPQATANAGSRGNAERFQTYFYCGQMRYSEIENARDRFLLHFHFHCLDNVEINFIKENQGWFNKGLKMYSM